MRRDITTIAQWRSVCVRPGSHWSPATDLFFTGFSVGVLAGLGATWAKVVTHIIRWSARITWCDCDVAARTRPLQPSFLLLWAAAWVVPVASPSPSRRPVCAVRQLSGVIGAERTATKSKSNYRPAAHQQVCNFFVSYFSFHSKSLNWGHPDFFDGFDLSVWLLFVLA